VITQSAGDLDHGIDRGSAWQHGSFILVNRPGDLIQIPPHCRHLVYGLSQRQKLGLGYRRRAP
jgi:hypothetical protein